jgi:HEAT repeat protein
MTHIHRIFRIAPTLLLAAWVVAGSWFPVRATAAEDRPAAELALWEDLASRDASKGYRAIWALVGSGDRAVQFLRGRLLSAAVGPNIRKLIEDLDDKRFAVREAASRELRKLGPAAGPALREALEKAPSAEVRRRVSALLAQLTDVTPLAVSGEELRDIRAIQVLEYIGTNEARAVLRSLAGGTPGARTTEDARAALRRLSQGSKLP